MAIINKIVLAATVLSSVALAVPLNERAVLVKTITETDWATVNVTSTVWVSDAGPAPTAPVATSAQAVTSSAAVTQVATSSAPASVESSPVIAPSSDSPATFAQVSTSSLPVTTAIPTTPAPTTMSTVPASTASVASATSSAVAAVGNSVPAGSTTATCEGETNACVGDVTHWDGGLGACGWNVDTNSDMEIALPFEFMGTQSNGNPYCGRSLTIYNPTSGASVQATVGDKCMGCVDRAIDLTDVLFTAIVPDGDGRVSGIEWWFN